MDQLKKLFGSLSLRQQLTLAAAVILVGFGIFGFVHWNRERDFKPLYSNLSAEDAGAIVAKLREGGIEFRLLDSDGTILVPSEQVAELRLQMATAGIPKSGRIGYELFDKTNLGTTDFAEQVNYHRAVEGELERSVMAMTGVEQARVHITFTKDSVFTESRQEAKASVMVKLKRGFTLSQSDATAIAQLVSSAVEGLGPERVSVMDVNGNLLMRPKKPNDGTEADDDLLQYKAKLEKETLDKINSVLDPLLGSAKYRASVDIDCDLTSGEQSEETYDPNSSVITSSQRTEEGSISREATSGVPGTASNLPKPPAPRPVVSGPGLAKRSEVTAYETSRTVRRLHLPQGIVRRMSISVLVDQDLRWEKLGKGSATHVRRIIEPPSADRMKSIQSVVAAAAGFNEKRGDQLTVETLPFESTLTADPPSDMLPAVPATHPPAPKFSPLVLGGVGGALLLVLAIIAALISSRRRAKAKVAVQSQIGAQNPTTTAESLSSAGTAQSGEPESGVAEKPKEQPLDKLFELPPPFKLPPMLTTKTEVLTRQVADEARKDPAALAQVVRTWLSESK
ncbi:MAG TPA: flagellar basal-body MS-ring/collar protein FliF [Bryobacteraceae bacterium]|jgi:flagellar M-ring protein FliF|nr:flagellar basal-body MS-ring/collar protein FliF [Bryobacteraceae bacterium]